MARPFRMICESVSSGGHTGGAGRAGCGQTLRHWHQHLDRLGGASTRRAAQRPARWVVTSRGRSAVATGNGLSNAAARARLRCAGWSRSWQSGGWTWRRRSRRLAPIPSRSSRMEKAHPGRRQHGRSEPPPPEPCLAQERYANMLGPISSLTSMITSAGTWFLRAAARIASVLGAS